MVVDTDIITWVLEFLLRQPMVPDHVITKLLVNSDSPVGQNNPCFKKTLILRSMKSDISSGYVPDSILESLEVIEELDRRSILKIPDSMKSAYCAVAVECTVKYLAEVEHNNKFFEAVKRIWRERVGDLEGVKKSELVTEELRERRDEIEAAVWNCEVRKRLLERTTRNDSLRLVRVYLEEALAMVGPSFIEVVTKRGRELKRKGKANGNGNEGTDNAGMVMDVDCGVVHGDDPKDQSSELVAADCHASKAKGTGKRDLPRKQKHAVVHRRCKGPAKLIDSEEAETDTNSTKCNILSTPEVNEVQQALNNSSKELQALVKDPLPDALHLSGHIMAEIGKAIDSSTSGLAQKTRNCEPEVDNHNREGVDASKPSSSNAVEGDDGIPSRSEPKNDVPKPSLMERNSSARTFEWDDSVDGSPEGTNGMNRIRLDSPRKLNVLPLNMYRPQKFVRRRKIKRWTLEEEDALREGVQKFGVGNWKLILKSKSDIFAERTEVDLKDKWRNLTK